MTRLIHTTLAALMLASVLVMAGVAPAVATSSVEQTENADTNADVTTNNPVIVVTQENNNTNSNTLENSNTNANENAASATATASSGGIEIGVGPGDDSGGPGGNPGD